MSAGTRLYNFASAAINRPAGWIWGILVAAAGTVAGIYFTNLLTPVQIYFSEKTAEKECQYWQTPLSNDSQFIILVSPLKFDPDGSQKERVKSAFHGAKGFHVVPICESVGFDYSKDMQITEDATRKRAWDLIKARHADLLLFGEVRERDKAVKVWAVNEHGGCDSDPKSTIIEHGEIKDDFTAEEKENLIKVSLEEMDHYYSKI